MLRVLSLIALLASGEAFMLAAPRGTANLMRNGAITLQAAETGDMEFRFGNGAAAVVGYQGGAFRGTGVANEPQPVFNGAANNFQSEADAFRFGANRQVVGFQGGSGKGMGVENEPRPVFNGAANNFPSQADAFRFGSNRQSIGFLGGAGNGMMPNDAKPKHALYPGAPMPAPAAPSPELEAPPAPEAAVAEEPVLEMAA